MLWAPAAQSLATSPRPALNPSRECTRIASRLTVRVGLCYDGSAMREKDQAQSATPPPASRLEPGNYRSIARGAGLTPQHVSRVLRGMKGTSLHVAARIAEAAGVTLDELHAFITAQPSLVVRPRQTMLDRAPEERRTTTRTRTSQQERDRRHRRRQRNSSTSRPRRDVRSGAEAKS